MIGSNNNQLCLSASSDNVEACPCDNEIAQRWILSDDKILSGNSKGCLGLVGTTINVGKCQVGVGSGTTSWKTYHVAPSKFFFFTHFYYVIYRFKLLTYLF